MTENIGCRFNDIEGFEVQKYETYTYNGKTLINQVELVNTVFLMMII